MQTRALAQAATARHSVGVTYSSVRQTTPENILLSQEANKQSITGNTFNQSNELNSFIDDQQKKCLKSCTSFPLLIDSQPSSQCFFNNQQLNQKLGGNLASLLTYFNHQQQQQKQNPPSFNNPNLQVNY